LDDPGGGIKTVKGHPIETGQIESFRVNIIDIAKY
jgi:hypothetical protein